NVNIDNLYVEEGSVTMGSGSRSMTVHLANDTHVDVGTHTAQFDLNMAFNGGVAELKHTGNTGKVTLAGNITLGGGSQLNLHGGTGVTYALNGASYGGGNAVLSVEADKVEFNTQSTTILGTLRAEKNLEIYSSANGELERSIAQLDIANKSRVTLNERTWKTIWNIDSLTGEGELYWNSNTTHYNTSRLILKGDGGFTGTISLARNRNNASRTHGAFIELASDTAAKNAVISLNGTNANSVASLAVNTLNATIKGLEGNEHSYVYAGESMDAAELSGDSRPPSTRNATLVVNVDSGKQYTYAGTLGAGLEFIKTGAGTQNLTGTIAARNVAVWDGVLDVSAADIQGRIAIGLGATLNAGDHLVLGAGQVLSAMQGMEGVYSSASLSGSLTLDGGSLGFDAHALLAANSRGNAAISLDSIAIGSGGGVIHFDNYTSLSAGVTYTLASGQGNWSGLTDQLRSSGLGFYSATYSSNQDGDLLVTLRLNDNAKVWNGKEGASTWHNYSFGQNSVTMDANSVAVFDDSAEVKVVDITRSFSQPAISKIFITGESDYTFRSGGNPTYNNVATQSLTHSSIGTTVIESGFAVNGETVIENGTMVLKGLNQLRGSISGAGTLAIDWGAYDFDWRYEDETMYALNIQGLDTLHVKSGGYGHADSGSIAVNNVILEEGTSFTQSKNTDLVTNMVTKEAAAVRLNGGTLGGSWKQEGSSSINVSGDAYLNSRLTQNGHQLTQSGGGTLHIGADSAAVLQNYKISSGTLRYDSGAMSEGNGTLEVAGGTLHVQNGAGLAATLIKVSGGTLQVDSGASLMGNTALQLSNAAATATLESYNSYTGGTTIDAGTLEVTANGGLGTGAVAINGGSLVVGAAARGALSSISGLSMSGGILDLSAIQFNAYDAMELNGEFSVSGGTINLGSSLSATGTSYAIFDISNAALDWSLDTLGENLMVNGTLLSSYKDVTLGVNDGLATITFGSFDLSNIIINNGETRSMTESELKEFGASIIINEGGTLNLTAQKSGAVAVTGITGAGTLGLNVTDDYANTLSVASGFTGTTHLQSGKFTFKDAAFGGSLRMTGDTGIQATADTTVAGSLAMDGAAEVKVADGKTLQVNGAISGDSATLTKDGTGALVLNGAVKLGNVNTNAGMLTVANSGAEGNAITTLDQTAGILCVAEDAKLHIGTVNVKSNAGVVLKHGAELTIATSGPVITNRGTVDARLESINGGTQYTVANSNIEIINAHVANRKTGDTKLSNKLTNSSVENAGGATLTVDNDANTLTGVHATEGNVTVLNIASLELKDLEIAAQKTITAAAVVVSELAKLEAGATLNADLVLASGATVKLGGTMTLSGALELQTGLTLSGTVLDIVEGLAEGESYTLFTGVESLDLKESVTLFNMRSLAAQTVETLSYGPLMDEGQVAAADYFRNLTDNSGLVLYYDSGNQAVSIMQTQAVPEPATATLSLLALAALAARRRRK
ncbi:MAG: PEP-CTERM sorting domain-containing protein, partial [Akkermansia sp.]|nr:PEP-CTERM sorting domain-containing protein [Akkermansia sp.]